MEGMSQRWSDDRLDDLNHKVDDLGRRVDNGFARTDAPVDVLRAEVRTEIGSLRSEVNGRINALQHTLILLFGGMAIATLAAGFLGLIATQI
jgi:hypothetical protein